MALLRRNILQVQRVQPTTAAPVLGPSISSPQQYSLAQARVNIGPKPQLYGSGVFRSTTKVSVNLGANAPETRQSNIVVGTLGLSGYKMPSTIPSVGQINAAGIATAGFMSFQRNISMESGETQGLSSGVPWSSIASRKIITKDFFLGGQYVVPTKIETLSLTKQEYAVTLKNLGIPEGFEYYGRASIFEPKEFTALKLADFGAKSVLRTKSFLGERATISFKFE